LLSCTAGEPDQLEDATNAQYRNERAIPGCSLEQENSVKLQLRVPRIAYSASLRCILCSWIHEQRVTAI
jgi:hypothetical protein